MAFGVWLTGLPGAGKSTVAGLLQQELARRGVAAVILAMDDRRTHYHPNPSYTDEERAQAYRMFVAEAAVLVAGGENVILDAAAPRAAMRRAGREAITAAGGRFVEVCLSCPLEVAMEREAARPQGQVRARLYAQALERQRTGREFPGLGQVPGVDVDYEVGEADLVIDIAVTPAQEAATRIADLVLQEEEGEA